MTTTATAVIRAIESRFEGKRILVVGDLMLDRHIWGKVTRISPEAPVPVVRVARETSSPGGAGNVALNLAELGISVILLGLIGDDDAAIELQQLLEANGIDGRGIIRAFGRPTTTKQRIIGGHQQMLRLDHEDESIPSDSDLLALERTALASIPGCAVVVISDYAKGVITPRLAQAIITCARHHSIPVLVDPKGKDWSKYRGATLLKPNRSELALIARGGINSIDDLIGEGRRVVNDLGLECLIVTLSEDGILVIGHDELIRMPAAAKDVFDVSGAGDTVLATVAAGTAMGFSRADTIHLANVAAAVVIGKVGTVPITNGELLVEVLADCERVHGSKICDAEHLLQRVKLWRAQGQKIVFTNGCFDLLHAGHISYLEAARAAGDRLLVGINTDRSVRTLKGPTRPINREQDRALVLSSLAAVDGVILFDEDTPLALIKSIRPDVLVKGADYRLDQVVGATDVISWGGEVKLMPLVDGLSTTSIAAKMRGSE